MGLRSLDEHRHKLILAVSNLVAIGFIAFGLLRLVQNTQNGIGLVRYIEPEYGQLLASIPSHIAVYTNYPSLLALIRTNEGVGRGIGGLPKKYDPVTRLSYEEYESEYQILIDRLENNQMVIFWFKKINRENTTSLEELTPFADVQDHGDLLIIGTF